MASTRSTYSMKPLLRLLLLAACSLIVFSPVRAQDAATPRARAEQFLTAVSRGEIDAAYELVFAGSTIPAVKPGAIDMLKRQTQAALPVYGRALGHELAIEKTFGTSVVRLVYIHKFEKHPIIWEFFFYRADKTWILSQVLFNDQFNGLRGTDIPMAPGA